MILTGAIIAALLLLILIQENRRRKQDKEQNRKRIREEYGEKPAALPVRGEQVKIEKAFREDDMWLDDITWNDLDMDAVMRRIDYTRSSAGHEVLYHMLRKPMDQVEELQRREALIEKLQQEETQRTELSVLMSEIGSTGKYALSDYMNQLEKASPGSMKKHIILDLMYLPGIGLLFFYPMAGLCYLFVLILVCIVDYFKEKAKVNAYLVSFAYLLRMLRHAEKIGKADLPAMEKEQQIIADAGKKLAGLSQFSGLAMSMHNPVGSSNPVTVLMEYLNMLFHFNLMKLSSMFRIVKKEKGTIEEMVHAIGYLDACISIAYYRASLEQYCVPKWQLGKPERIQEKEQEEVQEKKQSGKLEGTALYHPLLENPVKNDLFMDKNILLTGSNASGKSTFLKTMGICVIFAQTICTCNAGQFSAPLMRVMSSMTLRDDLQSGDSYYVAEIKAMKRIMDACRDDRYMVFCLVDEVLRGTNTIERIAASSRILKSLALPNVLCMAATHDIELTEILEPYFDNYHFQETIEEEDVKFSYELQKGKATSRNAIKLLQVMGYDKEVVREAEDMAAHFLQTGEWKE